MQSWIIFVADKLLKHYGVLGSTFGNYPHVKDAHGNATRMHCGKYLCWLGSYGAQRDTFDATQIDLL